MGFWDFRGFPLIFGIFLCIFSLLSRGWIHFRGFEPGKAHLNMAMDDYNLLIEAL